MRNIYALLFLIMLIMMRCRLDPPIYPQSVAVKTEENFQPFAPGNIWTYTLDYGAHNAEETITASGTTAVIANHTYTIYTSKINDAENSNQYFRQESGLYSLRKKINLFNDYIEFYYLKENALINQSWTNPVNETGTLDGATARTTTTLLENNILFSVLGKEYKNTYHTHVDLEYQLDGEFLPVFSFEFYVVKGIGIVQMNSNLLGYETYNYLKTYTGK